MTEGLIGRREFVGVSAALLAGACTTSMKGASLMEETYGIIGQMKAVPGKRAELIAPFPASAVPQEALQP